MEIRLIPSCTQGDHDRIKADPGRFRRQTYPLAGLDILDDGVERLLLRNCRTCHSTLSRKLGPSEPVLAVAS